MKTKAISARQKIGFSNEDQRKKELLSLEQQLKQKQVLVTQKQKEQLKSVFTEAVSDLRMGGLDEQTARLVVELISKRQVRNISLFH